MTKPISFGNVAVGLTTGSGPVAGELRPDTPFRILVLADLSGRTKDDKPGPNAGLAGRPLRVDRDNLDEVIAKFGPTLRLPTSDPLTLRFVKLEDFHPDSLYPRVELFRHVRLLRDRLQKPDTFAAAAAEVRGWQAKKPTAAPKPETSAKVDATPPPGGTGFTLDDLLGGERGTQLWTQTDAKRDEMDWNALVKQVVGPYLRSIPAADPQQGELVACVDEAATGLMRAILHAQGFQSLESTWRSLDFLVRRLETDSQLTIHLLDVSKMELANDLTSGDDLSRSDLCKLLVERTVNTPGGEPWTVVLGCYTFDATTSDAELLGRVAKIARQSGCAFLAAASSNHVRCDSFAVHPDPDDWQQPMDSDGQAAWESLRQLGDAAHVGLALPRFLLRQPYGKKSDPVESFAFEEMREPPDHESYLWGNPAFVSVSLLGEAFSRSGWDLRLGEVCEIDGLPVYTYQADGEKQLQPCGEALLTERAAEAIVDARLMPLLSIKNSDTIRLGSFQPLGQAAKTIAGRWH